MGGKKRCICRRSAGGGRRPFAGMKLLPEGRSLGRARPNSHQDESLVGLSVARKGYRNYLFFPFVCLYFDNLRRTLRGFRCCVFSGFVYSPARRENCAGGERRSRRRRARCFGVHFRPTKDVCGLALQETSLPCVTCRRYSDRAPEAPSYVLFYKRTGAAAAVCFRFGRCSLSNAVRFNFGRAVLSFCRLPLFLFWQCSPAVRISVFLLCGRAYGNSGRKLRAAGRFVCRFLRFLRASDVRVSRKARPAFYGGRALWDVSRETLTNAALCATIDTQSAE